MAPKYARCNSSATDAPLTEATTASPYTQATEASRNRAAAIDAEKEKRRRRAAMMSQISEMGSTQHRANTFRPHKMRLNPVDAHQLTLRHLVASTAQVGHSMTRFSKAQQPFIYGHRHGVAMFDLEKATLPALRRAASVVKAICERDGVVLFVGTRPGQQASVLAATKRLGKNGFHVTTERWMAGVITNAPKVLAPAVLKSLEGLDSEEVPNINRLVSQTLQPDLVIILNPIENMNAVREAAHANVPTIAITDSDVDPRIVTYPIPANDDSLRAVELIIGVLSKAGQEGLAQRAKKLDEADKLQRKVRRSIQDRQRRPTDFDPNNRGNPAQRLRNHEEE